jgi:hypothetical protein
VQTPENIAESSGSDRCLSAILAERSAQDEEAYKAIAYLYGAIKEDGKLRAWITQRATSDAIRSRQNV